jgi:peptidyl-prolyl cis-trans isomerase SurA
MHITNFSKISATLLLILCVACQPLFAAQSLDRIVAVVNGDAISQTELDNYTKMVVSDMQGQGMEALPPRDELQQQVLNRMILNKIQLQLAQQYGIEVDSLSVSQAIQSLAQQQDISVETLRRTIEAKGINYSDYREHVKTEMIIQTLQNKEVSQDVSITKADIENYLNSPAGQDNSGNEYKMSHILIALPESPSPEVLKKSQAKAEALVAKLKAGGDFKAAAIATSSGRQALNGGDLGWRPAGELPALFVSYAPTMEKGEVVGPIRSSSGFHIIKMQDKRVANDTQRCETHVRQILIKTDVHTSAAEAQRTLRLLKQQVAKGADFAKLAIQKSQENRTAEKGGDMGWVNEETVVPKFYQAMAKLRNLEISEPFETEDGWHLIQVLDRRTQRTSDEAAWNKAREVVGMRKANEALESWTKRIYDDARVEILLESAKQEKA